MDVTLTRADVKLINLFMYIVQLIYVFRMRILQKRLG